MSPLELILLLFAIVWAVPLTLLAAGVLATALGLYDPDLQDDTEPDGEADDE